MDGLRARTTKTVMTGAALGAPTHGASTVMHVQPGGVVVSRYTYIRARNANTGVQPWSISTPFVSPATGQRFSARPCRSSRRSREQRPRFDHVPTPSTGEWPEIVWLGAKGVYFRSPAYPAARSGRSHAAEDGKIDGVKTPELRGNDGRVVDLGSQLGVITGDGDQWGSTRTNDRKSSCSADERARRRRRSISVFDFRGKPGSSHAHIGAPTWRGDPDRRQADLPASSPMPRRSLWVSAEGCDGAACPIRKASARSFPFVLGSSASR